MVLKLGFSTCPNDTFIFDAAVHHKIDTYGIECDVSLGDVEEWNKKAFNAEIDISKLSYHAYAFVAENYLLLNSGSALGYKNGPLLIRRAVQIETTLKLQMPSVVFGTARLFHTSLFQLSWQLPGRWESKWFVVLSSQVEETGALLFPHPPEMKATIGLK